MNARLLFLIVGIILYTLASDAQTFNDALRYSQTQMGGTARYMGTAGSMGALGADFSLIATNPAGLAAFRKSDMVITPGFWNVRTNSKIDEPQSLDYLERSNKISLSNAGIVIASTPPKGNWTTVNFSFGLQRIADYNQEFFFQGNTRGSIIERYTALADGLQPNQLDDFEAGLAYDVGAIYGPGINGLYFNDLQSVPDFTTQKSQVGTMSGRGNELSLALSGNLDEKLMLGMTIGIPFYTFSHDKSYEETDPSDLIPVFNGFQIRERLDANGTGINAKFGAILMPVRNFRIGLALHTPTFLSITENFTNSMAYTFTEQSQTTLRRESPQGRFEYRVVTPWRTMGSLGYIIQNFGFISAEVEYVDYGSSSFRFKNATLADKVYERELNQDIKQRLGGALNIRTGLEYAKDMWRLRGGIIMDGSPFRGDNQFNLGYSLGAGMRENNFFVDLAYVQRVRQDLYSPYQIDNSPMTNVLQTVRTGIFVLTLGFKI
jgi:long-subunit fatty acid transport protein